MRSRSRFPLALVALLVSACQGKPEAQPASQAAGKPAVDAPRSDGASSPPPDASEQARPTAQDDPLGQRFMDPSWFRKDMLEGAEVIDVSRSEADENGFFASHILFALPEGTTAEQCADAVTAKVEPSVPGLERAVEADRIKITGSTDRYRVILICGEAKGVMRAYVSLEWFA